ncbi:MAG: hypothetical protein RSD36_16265 [Terrisporobacter sp.]
MDIYKNFIEETGAKKIVINTKEVLEGVKKQLESIETYVISAYKQVHEIENKLNTNIYTIDYIKEYMKKTKESMSNNIDVMFNSKIDSLEKDLQHLKERTLLSVGDKDISRNNILKLQSVLSNLSIEDKEQLFESSKDKDYNVLQILYLNVKESNPMFACEIMEYMDMLTGTNEIRIVESHINQIKGLKSYLTYDFIKSQDNAHSQETIYGNLLIGGTVSRIIEAYILDIERDIEKYS